MSSDSDESSDDGLAAVLAGVVPRSSKRQKVKVVDADDLLRQLHGGEAASSASPRKYAAEPQASTARTPSGPKGKMTGFFSRTGGGKSGKKSSTKGRSSSSSSSSASAAAAANPPQWIPTRKDASKKTPKKDYGKAKKRTEDAEAAEAALLGKRLKSEARYVWAKRILPAARVDSTPHSLKSSFVKNLGAQAGLFGRVRNPVAYASNVSPLKQKLRREMEIFFRDHPEIAWSFKGLKTKFEGKAAIKRLCVDTGGLSAKAVKKRLREIAKTEHSLEKVVFSDYPPAQQDPHGRGSASLVYHPDDLDMEDSTSAKGDWLWWPALIVQPNDEALAAILPDQIEEGDVWYENLIDTRTTEDFRLVRWFPLINFKSCHEAQDPIPSHYAVVRSPHVQLLKSTIKSRKLTKQKSAAQVQKSINMSLFSKKKNVSIQDRLEAAYTCALKYRAKAKELPGEELSSFSQSQSQQQPQSQSLSQSSQDDSASQSQSQSSSSRGRSGSAGASRRSSNSSHAAEAPSASKRKRTRTKTKERLEVGDTVFYETSMARSGTKNAGRKSVVAEITKLGDNSWLVVTKLGDRLRDMDNVQVRRRQSVLHRLVSTPCLAPPVSPPPPLTSFSPFDRVQICSVVCSEMERRW